VRKLVENNRNNIFSPNSSNSVISSLTNLKSHEGKEENKNVSNFIAIMGEIPLWLMFEKCEKAFT
jgi:hypothetical protein